MFYQQCLSNWNPCEYERVAIHKKKTTMTGTRCPTPLAVIDRSGVGVCDCFTLSITNSRNWCVWNFEKRVVEDAIDLSRNTCSFRASHPDTEAEVWLECTTDLDISHPSCDSRTVLVWRSAHIVDHKRRLATPAQNSHIVPPLLARWWGICSSFFRDWKPHRYGQYQTKGQDIYSFC